jgi:hypothetical protein
MSFVKIGSMTARAQMFFCQYLLRFFGDLAEKSKQEILTKFCRRIVSLVKISALKPCFT